MIFNMQIYVVAPTRMMVNETIFLQIAKSTNNVKTLSGRGSSTFSFTTSGTPL